jgi:hypothetical protein
MNIFEICQSSGGRSPISPKGHYCQRLAAPKRQKMDAIHLHQQVVPQNSLSSLSSPKWYVCNASKIHIATAYSRYAAKRPRPAAKPTALFATAPAVSTVLGAKLVVAFVVVGVIILAVVFTGGTMTTSIVVVEEELLLKLLEVGAVTKAMVVTTVLTWLVEPDVVQTVVVLGTSIVVTVFGPVSVE